VESITYVVRRCEVQPTLCPEPQHLALMQDLANQPNYSGQFDDNTGAVLPSSIELSELQQLLQSCDAAASNHLVLDPQHLSFKLSADRKAAHIQSAYRRHMVLFPRLSKQPHRLDTLR
jgi:hypothetical protein